ncbi:MAG: alpha-L-fucosidase [Phycisphaerae bacterium]
MSNPGQHGPVPAHLEKLASEYAENPHTAAMKWFRNAGLGLFLHYGLYALHGKGEWGMYNQAMDLGEYEKLAERFTAEKFDADFITDLACQAEAKYVNFTTKHHDGFCLWDSDNCAFNSANSAAGRDLVGEMAGQCRAKGLGFFLYYSYALDWHHPWFFSLDYFDRARPPYDHPEPHYLFRKAEDFRRYIDDVHAQLTELLTNYGPVAGVWFDPEMAYHAQKDLFPLSETYALIRKLQPHALVAFKHGATGEEDFAAPEGRGLPLLEKIRDRIGEKEAEEAQRAWDAHKDKRGEICDTLSFSWGYHEKNDENHIGPDEVMSKLAEAWRRDCNLLINTGPLPSGAIPEPDVKTLREVGRRIRSGEIPGAADGDAFGSTLPPSAPIT